MEPNFYILFITAAIPLIVGSLWYSPLMFNNAWMKAADMSEEKMKGANMAVIFGLAYVFGLFLAAGMWSFVVHQQALFGLFAADPSFAVEGSEMHTYFQDFMTKYGDRHRTFGHGAFHGGLLGVFMALPLLATNAMFERKSWKYIAINVGYWVVAMTLIGGVICQFI